LLRPVEAIADLLRESWHFLTRGNSFILQLPSVDRKMVVAIARFEGAIAKSTLPKTGRQHG
jgi:hypothetical protein